MPVQEVLSLLGILLVMVLVLGGCYLVTRWAGTGLSLRLGVPGGGGRLRVLERLSVGREHFILVVRAADRFLILGCSPSGFSVLCELTEEEGALWTSPPPSEAAAEKITPDFRAILQRFREKK
ncbi:MAG: flagellar biosynthetic protein FliO [Oscillospiraceae bacterium]|jgi:flagellar biogenesis protein FliO|nr:flagellar biosynthetic protein FliO [Oscillospiraceae bacterium]